MYAIPLSTQGSDNQTSSEFTNATLDHMMMTAYGAPLLYSDGGSRSSQWCQQWSAVIQHQGRHYSLPGGSIGKKYIDLLNEELNYSSAGAFPSERVIVYCSVMLQRDRLVRKGSGIHRLLERRMAMWQNGQFDALLQEATRCDLSLRNSRRPTSDDSQDHLIRVFTKLMLQGNVCAAVRWITELKPSDLTEVSHPNGKKSSITVFDVLRAKHPEPRIPKDLLYLHLTPCLV